MSRCVVCGKESMTTVHYLDEHLDGTITERLEYYCEKHKEE